MRPLFACLLPLLVGTAALAAPARDWTAAVRQTPVGGSVIGNPAARVKLVEYVSYTCPHCKHLVEQSKPVLDPLIRNGSTSLEIRQQIHDKIDWVAVALARCLAPARFPRYHQAVFAAQGRWFAKAAEYDRSGALAALPTNHARAKALAVHSGLAEIARAAGLSPAGLDRCFADESVLVAAMKSSMAIRADVTGTPAFEINERFVPNVTWAELEPQLRAAGAR